MLHWWLGRTLVHGSHDSKQLLKLDEMVQHSADAMGKTVG